MKEITAKECIGLVKLMFRSQVRDRITQIADVLIAGEYDDSTRERLNRWRKDTYVVWQDGNVNEAREYIRDYQWDRYEDVVLLDIDNSDDNPHWTRDPQHLALNNRDRLLRASVFIVVESTTEKVHIVKSRYFNASLNIT